MSRIYVFADESGNFDFSRQTGASRYFIITTITTTDLSVGHALQDLRRHLAWNGHGLTSELHAAADTPHVRDAVFGAIAPYAFRVDATIIEKARVTPTLRADDRCFYENTWRFHMGFLASRIVTERDELFVVGASLGTKASRVAFHTAIANVVASVSPTTQYRVASWDARSDSCLQVADYCAWAIQRRWERGDTGGYLKVRAKIGSEYDVFKAKAPLYY